MCLKALDTVYQQRAVPAGSARYWSWLFAAPEIRAPLLGMYALQAEWSALMNPATERSAAQLKLGWWQEEMRRLIEGGAVHPISVYLTSLPAATGVDFAPLAASVAAAGLEAGGSPIERGADLAPHAAALWGGPLLVVAQYVRRSRPAGSGIEASAHAYATGEYLARALSGFALQQRYGRVPFAIDELLAAGIEDEDVAQAFGSERMRVYLAHVAQRAAGCFVAAVQALPNTVLSQQRHISILCALGARRLRECAGARQSRRWQDMLLAWKMARRPNALRLLELPR